MPHRFNGTLTSACWWGLVAGCGEVAVLGIRKFYFGRAIRFGADVVWMAPLADAALFLACGFVLYGIETRWRARVSTRLVVAVLVFLTLMSWLLMYRPLHPYARLLLSAGLATQISRMIAQWSSGFHHLVRRSLPWMIAVVIVAAVGIRGLPAMAMRQAVANLPRSQEGAPNVLLITLDTVRASNLSLYGYERPTMPNLERWGKAGVVFDRAIATAPWTLTSHASIFTGRWPHELSADGEKPLDHKAPTLAESLRDHGYLTAGFVANTFYCGYEFGLGRGFLLYDDYSVSLRELLIASSLARSIANASLVRRVLGFYDNIPRKNAESLTTDFLDWVPPTGGRPFFAFLNYFDAHEAYLPPAPFAGKFGQPRPRSIHLLNQDLRRSMRFDWNTRPAGEIRAEVDMYDGAIAYLDAQLDRLFLELSARDLLNNTVVIVTSDHGEHFGEHGLFQHGNSLYDPLLHVPLMILYGTHVPRGLRVGDPVSLRDIPATVMDLVAQADGKAFPGSSLARYWAGGSVGGNHGADSVLSEVSYADWGKNWYPIAKGDIKSLISDRYHYIKNGDGREELYATREDPREERDLSGDKESQPILERFRTELKAVLGVNRQ